MPTTTPMPSAVAKPATCSPPATSNAPSTSKVVKEVTRVRPKVWFSERLTISTGVPRRMERKFSRMRSETTMVSFNE